MKDSQHEKYRAFDLAVWQEIKREMADKGIVSYPAICDECRGDGKRADGTSCENCGGHGSCELAV